MKKYLILLLVALAALIAAQFTVGMKAEEYYQTLLERIRESGFEILAHRYERGWFGASAETRFQLADPEGLPPSATTGTGQLGFVLQSEVSHGPLTGAGAGLAEIVSSIRPVDGGGLPADYTGEMHTFVALDGEGRTTLAWPPAQGRVESSGVSFSFQGLRGEVVFNPLAKAADWTLNSPGAEITGSDGVRVALIELNLDSRSWVGKTGLTLGNGSFSLGELTALGIESGESLRARGLALEVESSESEQGERISGIAGYRVEHIEVGDRVYGPGNLWIELSNLSAPGLLRIRRAIQETGRQPMSESQRGMAIMSALMSVAPDMLSQDPGVAVNELSLATPDGLIEGHFSLRSIGLKWEQIPQGAQALERLSGDLSVRMPEPVFLSLLQSWVLGQMDSEHAADGSGDDGRNDLLAPDQRLELALGEAQGTLDRLLRQKFLVRGDDGTLATVAALSNGLLTINGKMFPMLR